MMNMEFKLQNYLEQRKITQKKLADDLSLSTSLVNQYVKQKCYPDYTMLCKIADYLGVTTDELLGRESEIVNLNWLDDTRKTLIKEIINSSDVTVARLDAFYQGIRLAETEREKIVKQLKGNQK